MVSTRRTRKTKDDETATIDAADTAEAHIQSPTRRSARRTRSNSAVEKEETASNKEETTPVVKQKRQSKRKSTRKRRGSSVDDHEEDAVVETEEAAVQEQETVGADSDIQLETQKDDEEQQQSFEMEVLEPQPVAKKPASESIASLSLSKEKRLDRSNERGEDNDNSNAGNELTKLIPGYVAPLKLDTSSLDSYRPTGGLADLCKRAQQTDASTAGFVVDAAEPHARSMKKTSNGCMPITYASLYSSFKHGTKRAPDHSAGAGWFGMMPTPMTDKLKTDLAVIRNRNYLDPKRFYKSADNSKNKVMQLGTVIEGSAEFYSSRLTKKQRRSNLTEEIMADPAAADYTRNKYKKMQQTKSEKGRKYNKKKLSKRARRGY